MAGLGWTGLKADAVANAAGRSRLHAADSAIAAWIVPADEEATIAEDAMALLTASA